MQCHQHDTSSVVCPDVIGCFSRLSQDTLLAHHRLIRPGCVSHGGTAWSFGSPCCISTLQPQPVTALFCCSGKVFDCLPLGLPSDPHLLHEPCGGPGYKASAAHLLWPHLPAFQHISDFHIFLVDHFAKY